MDLTKGMFAITTDHVGTSVLDTRDLCYSVDSRRTAESVLPEDATLKLVNAVVVGFSVLYYCYPQYLVNGCHIQDTDLPGFGLNPDRVTVLGREAGDPGGGGGGLSVL